MIQFCQFCMSTTIVPGPRNKKVKGYCGGVKCRPMALRLLKEVDLLRPQEEEELQSLEKVNDQG